MTRLEKPVLGQQFLTRIFTPLAVVFTMMLVAIPGARAELRLDEWKTYGAMAEQGGVCAAFARVMELQGMLDTQTGKLWLERRKFSGAVVRQASILEGLEPASGDEIDDLVNRYSIWLLTNLTSNEDSQKLNAESHVAASHMVSDACATLYERADEAIFKKNPGLNQCSTAQNIAKEPDAPVCKTPTNTAKNGDAKIGDDAQSKSQITALLRNNMTLSKELDDLRRELAALKSASNPARTNTQLTSKAGQADTLAGAKTPAKSVEPEARPLPKTLPVAKPGDHIPKMARNSIITAEDTTLISNLSLPRDDDVPSGPKFIAQLGSFRSHDGAKAGMVMLREQFPRALAGIDLEITTAKLATGDILQRVVTSPMSRDMATKVCAAMWDKRLGCLLRAAN